MSEQLLAQLVESPSDEAYLVYADTLLEQGDAQGELIALAVRGERSERQLELQTTLDAELLGELRNVTLTWKHGFVDQVSMTIGAIKAAADRGLFDRRELALTRTVLLIPDSRTNKPRDEILARLAGTPIARAVKRFELTGVGIAPTSNTLATLLANCPLLTDLAWSATGLDFAVLEACPRLERLKFWEPLDAITLARVVALPLRLRGLVVAVDPTSDQLPEPIAEIVAGTRLAELNELIVPGCGFGNALLRALPGSVLATRLRVLGLPWLRVEMAAVEAARGALASTQLEYARRTIDAAQPDAYALAKVYRLGLDRAGDGLVHAEAATRARPREAAVWSELGFIYDELERDEDTVRTFDKALAINPKMWWSRVTRAKALRYLDRRADAELDLKAALEIDPARVCATHGRLGELYASWSKIEDARASYSTALELADTSASRTYYLPALVMLLLEANDAPAARAVMEAQRSHFGDNLYLHRLDSFVASCEGDGARALELSREHPTPFEGESRFSWFFAEAAALRSLGRMDEAHACYERVVVDADCPDWIGLAWLGQSLTGADPFAAIGGVTMHEVNDQIAAAARARGMIVHDSSTHPTDRFSSAITAIAADALAGRSTRARANAVALDRANRRGAVSIYLVELLRSVYARAPEIEAVQLHRAYLHATSRVAN